MENVGNKSGTPETYRFPASIGCEPAQRAQQINRLHNGKASAARSRRKAKMSKIKQKKWLLYTRSPDLSNPIKLNGNRLIKSRITFLIGVPGFCHFALFPLELPLFGVCFVHIICIWRAHVLFISVKSPYMLNSAHTTRVNVKCGSICP